MNHNIFLDFKSAAYERSYKKIIINTWIIKRPLVSYVFHNINNHRTDNLYDDESRNGK